MPNDYPDWTTTNTFITNQLISVNVDPGDPILGLDVSIWSSLIIHINMGTTSGVFEIQWQDSLGNFICDQHISAPAFANYTMTIPAIGATFNMTASGGVSGAVFTIDGSTRAAENAILSSSCYLPRALAYTGPVTVNQTRQLSAIDGGDDYTTLNGLCTFDFSSSTVPGALFLTFQFQGGGGSDVMDYGQVTAGQHLIGQFVHPLCPIIWQFFPNTTNANASVNLVIAGGA
jgi:hypothetical protein